MSSVAQIVNLARQLAYTDSTQYPDSIAIEDFNNCYHDIENDIVRYVDEDYYYDIQYTDLVANQAEYVLPLSTSSISGFKKISDLSVKYVNDGYNVYSYTAGTKTVVLSTTYSALSAGMNVTFVNKYGYTIGTDTIATVTVPGLEFTLTNGISILSADDVLQTQTGIEYYKSANVSTSNYDMDENRYRNNQPAYQPLYKIADNSIWIYPVATENVTNGLKMTTVRDQVDLTMLSTESDIKIPRQYHNFIAFGIVPRIYQRR